jgi:LPS-assembly lipoprotein
MTTSLSRRFVRLGSLGAVAALLAGCGFKPVYMPTASGKAGPAQRELASVYVGVIPDRPGQLMRQALQEQLGNDSGTPAAYDLNVSFSVAGEGIAIQSDSIATRIRLIGSASWSLVSRDQKRTILISGSARAMDDVNIFGSQYFASDLETEADEKRIAENVATQIATRLGAWFRQQADKQEG